MHVEFIGIPRERAGVSTAQIDAANLGQVLGILAAEFPGLRELITPDRLHPSLAANLNGETFVSDPATPFAPEDHLLLLSADVGG